MLDTISQFFMLKSDIITCMVTASLVHHWN